MTARPTNIQDLAWRRFGPAFERKCNNPRTIEYARQECQRADACQFVSEAAGINPNQGAKP